MSRWGWWAGLLALSVQADPEGVRQLADSLHQSYQDRGLVIESSAALDSARRLASRLSMDGVDGGRVILLDDPMPTAASLPDGRIYLNSGLFLYLEDEADLAFVLAHEAAHVGQVHHARERAAADLSLELQADQVALDELRRLGYSPVVASRVLRRLVAQSDIDVLEKRLSALPAGDAPKGAPIAGLAGIRRIALARWIERGSWSPVDACQQRGCDRDLPESERARLAIAVRRLSGASFQPEERAAADTAVVREQALWAEASGQCQRGRSLWSANAWPQAGKLVGTWLAHGRCVTAPAAKPLKEVQPDIPRGWTLVGDRGSVRIYSRDGEAVQRLEIRWLADEPGTPPLLALDRRLQRWRARHPRYRAELVRAWAQGSGYAGELLYRDEHGLRWSAVLMEWPGRSGRLLAEFRAPRLHYFERDRGVATRLAEATARAVGVH